MISIIIPTLNEEKIIASTISALRKGLTLPHEIIVSDGKSADKTVQIAEQYADKVIVFGGSHRQTIAEGRNDGAKAASGEFLVFFDADCSIQNPQDFFTHAVESFVHNPEVVAMTAPLRVHPEHETLADKIFFSLTNFTVRIKNNILNAGESAGEFQMLRRSTFEILGGYNKDLVTREDADLFMRLAKIGRVISNSNLTVYHTGRRAHSIGWARLLSVWAVNTVSFAIFKKPVSKEWTPIR